MKQSKSKLNLVGRLNYIFFLSNFIMMTMSVLFQTYFLAMFHCIISFICWLALQGSHCYDDE